MTPFREALEKAYEDGWNERKSPFLEPAENNSIIDIIAEYPAEDHAGELVEALKAVMKELRYWKANEENSESENILVDTAYAKGEAVLAKIQEKGRQNG